MSDFDFTYNDDPENPYTSVDNSHNSESDNDDHVEDHVADESHNCSLKLTHSSQNDV